jgi:hypothetical protein
MELLNERRLRELVYGGAVLGAGGGGSIEAGLAAGRQALAAGAPRMMRIEELPPKTRIVTLSVVGSVSRMTGDQRRPEHGLALRRLAAVDRKSIGALIPSEVGPQGVTYGWLESAATGVPIVDAPCNGRAHPLGLMGSLGLHHHPRYITSTVAVGESREDHTRVELVLREPVTKASEMVRQAAGKSGLPLAVARNPLPASYVRKHAAIGGLSYAANVGKIVLNELSRGLPALLERLQKWTGGRVLAEGRVSSAALTEKGGFTVGSILMRELDGSECSVAVCNEYLALQRNGETVAAFPDLITLFEFDSAMPLSSPEVRAGHRVAVFCVPRVRLKLGSTMRDDELLRPLERLLNVTLRGRGTASEPVQPPP